MSMDERNRQIHKLRESGDFSLQEIADKFNLTKSRISQIIGPQGGRRNIVVSPEFRKLQKTNPKAYLKEYRRVRRIYALEKLGGECVKCGNDDLLVLCIDHKDGMGYKERKDNISSHEVVMRVIRGEIDNYQVLCANCNVRKARLEGEYARVV